MELEESSKSLLRKVLIRDNVIIGSGTVILESEIGEGTTVGALSLVKGNLEDWSVYAGNPIKYLKPRKKKWGKIS